MNLIRSFAKLFVGAVLFVLALTILVAVFELPPLLINLLIGPMHPELALVYTLIEIGVIMGILIFSLPRGYAWFSQHWDQWAQKNLKSGP
jgi:hypothetical protein